jgi:hypothetical protein
VRQDEDLKSLDELIRGFGGSSDAGRRSSGSCDLLLEHLQAARRDLLGSRAGEYRSSLQFANDALSCISNKGVRAETKKTLQSLLAPSPVAPAAAL